MADLALVRCRAVPRQRQERRKETGLPDTRHKPLPFPVKPIYLPAPRCRPDCYWTTHCLSCLLLTANRIVPGLPVCLSCLFLVADPDCYWTTHCLSCLLLAANPDCYWITHYLSCLLHAVPWPHTPGALTLLPSRLQEFSARHQCDLQPAIPCIKTQGLAGPSCKGITLHARTQTRRNKTVMAENTQQPASSVHFLNIASTYVSDTKLECHYTLPAGMKGSTSDWIGIFKVGSSSIRDYDTFVWTTTSASSADELPSHCTVQFQAYYLPRPGEQQYQFRYVDQHGTVKGISEPFVFIEPRPLEDLVTLEDEEASMDMILVLPKSTFLQQQLELSQLERNDLMKVILALEEEVSSLKKKVQDLEAALEGANRKHDKLRQHYQELEIKEQTSREQLDLLKCKETEHQKKIVQLEDDSQAMSLKLAMRDKDIDTFKTRINSLEADKEELDHRFSEVTTELKQSQLQIDALREKLRCSQDVLSASQQKVVLLGEELGTVSSIRDRTISDLHKCRLETADLALKMSDLSLKYEDGMGQWWQEKTALNQIIEAKRDQIVNLKSDKLTLESNLQEEKSQRQKLQCKFNLEKDACQVQLSESRRELSELKSALKVAQMEKEQLRQEKQEMMQYVRSLEERLNKFADEKWSEDKELEEEATPLLNTLDSQGLPDSDDESLENPSFPLHEELFTVSEQISTSLPAFPRETHKVVINQPAPLACQLQPLPEDNPDSW